MTRGRKKDLTLPPSRTLSQQRDYRVRRAQYLSDLEGRYRRLESENEELREELHLVKSGHQFALLNNPATIQVVSELSHQLEAVSILLHRFEGLTSSSVPGASSSRAYHTSQTLTSHTNSTPTTYQDKSIQTECFLLQSNFPGGSSHGRAPGSESPTPTESSTLDDGDANCCDGYFDCQGAQRDGIMEG